LRDIHCFAVPVLAMPVPTVKAMEHMDDEAIENIVRFTSPFAISGHPAIALPCGFTGNRGPISLQLVGPYFGEAPLIKFANAFQQQTDWHKRRPVA
jgi:Asp-tRNA(Asn)/Glu-tRNA(Gln) amidotransferase A subunit family amidase